MKKTLCLLLGLTVLLSSCSSKSPSEIENSTTSQTSQDISYSDVSSSPVSSAIAMNDITITGDTKETYTFTVEQQENLLVQLNQVLDKFKSGEYPLTVQEATDYAPFAQPWPDDLEIPDVILSDELLFTTDGFEMYGVGIRLTFTSQYGVDVNIYSNSELPSDDANYWTVDNLTFLKK